MSEVEETLHLHLPGGAFTSTQMQAIARIVADGAGDSAELSPRREIVLHPAPGKRSEIVSSLEALGLVCAPSPSGGEQALDTPPGVREQEEQGLFSVTVQVPEGRLSGQQMRKAADLAQRHGDGTVHLTIGRNLLLSNLPKEKVIQVLEGLDSVGLKVR